MLCADCCVWWVLSLTVIISLVKRGDGFFADFWFVTCPLSVVVCLLFLFSFVGYVFSVCFFLDIVFAIVSTLIWVAILHEDPELYVNTQDPIVQS